MQDIDVEIEVELRANPDPEAQGGLLRRLFEYDRRVLRSLPPGRQHFLRQLVPEEMAPRVMPPDFQFVFVKSMDGARGRVPLPQDAAEKLQGGGVPWLPFDEAAAMSTARARYEVRDGKRVLVLPADTTWSTRCPICGGPFLMGDQVRSHIVRLSESSVVGVSFHEVCALAQPAREAELVVEAVRKAREV